MKTTLFALASLLVGAVALSQPVPARVVMNPGETMVNVAGYNPSRISTVTMCLGDAQVRTLADLMTDTEVETFDRCMESNT